jgi:hypothetical protein
MVVWNSPNGRNEVQIMALAALWVDSVNKGTIQAHFIDAASFNSTVTRMHHSAAHEGERS